MMQEMESFKMFQVKKFSNVLTVFEALGLGLWRSRGYRYMRNLGFSLQTHSLFFIV